MNKNFIRLIIVILILSVGIGIFKILNRKKKFSPRTKRGPTLPIVETIKVKTFDDRIIINAHGTVVAQEIGSLIPEITGKVVYISPKLRPGAGISKGELLIKIDETDYELALENAKANLMHAENQYKIMKANSEQAIEAYRLEYGHHKKVPPLIAKIPQLKQALANVEKAKVSLKKAEIDLKRTKIYAPYDLIVLTKNVGLGDVVSPSKVAATYYDIHSLEIKVPIQPEKLDLLDNNATAQVSLLQTNRVFEAKLIRYGPEINQKTRLIDIYLSVKTKDLRPGEFVIVKLQGKIIKGLAKIPCSAIHNLDTVWVLNRENKIFPKKIKVMDEQEMEAVVLGLKQGDEVVVTPLGDVEPGLEVVVK